MVREEEDVLAAVFDILKESKEPLMEGQREQPVVYLEDVKNRYQAESAARKKAGLLSREDIHHDQQVLDTLERYVMNLKKENVQDGEAAFAFFASGLMSLRKSMTKILTRQPDSWNMPLILWKALLQEDRSWWCLSQS